MRPRLASQPSSGSPGQSSRRRSASSTVLPGLSVKRPLVTGPPASTWRAWPPASDAAEPVDDHDRGQAPLELGLAGLRKRRPSRQDGDEARQVVVGAVQVIEQGPGERVAHDDERGHPLALDHAPDVGRVEAFGMVWQADGAAAHPRVEADDLAGAVHQGRRRQHAQARGRAGQHGVESGAVGGPGDQLGDGVTLAPQHPLRPARRAPGVDHEQVVRRWCDRR